MAAGFLIFIVLQADELAGGSAKAAAEGASKLALSLAGGAALAGAMQAKNAVTTSEWYGKTAGALSTTKGLGWLGNAGLKTREDSLAYRNKQGEIIDADVNRRDISTNKTRLQAIANSKDPRLAREKAAIAKKLVADKQMDETSMALLGNNIGTIVNDENEKNGWVPKSLKKSLKDSLPSLFIRSDLEKATGLNESIITKALDDTKGNVIEAAKVLAANEHAKTNEGGMQKALEKYTDEKAKVLIQFNKNLENAKDESLVANLLDASEYTQKKVMEKLAQNPATMRTVLEQINGSGLSSEKKQAVTQLFQTYLDNNGGKFTEKQLHYVNENIPWLDTGMADDIVEQSKKRVPLRKAFNEAIIEDVEFEKQSQAKMENIIEKQRESARSSQAEQVYEAATKANAARDSLSKAIEWAKKTNSIAQTPESRKTLDTLVKKWNDTYGPNHK